MGARQDPDLDLDGTDVLRPAAVGTNALVHDLPAHDRLLGRLERVLDEARALAVGVAELGFERLGGLLADPIQGAVTLFLVGDPHGFADLRLDLLADAALERFVFERRLPLHRRLTRLAAELRDHPADLGDRPLAGLHGAQQRLFGDLLAGALDHDRGIRGARDHQVQVALVQRVERRVDDVLAVDHADPHARDRPVERDSAHGQRGAAAHDAEHVRVVRPVVGQDVAYQLGLVHEAFGEHRTAGAIDQAGRQDFLLAGATLAAEEAAGDLAGRIHLLAVLDEEREPALGVVGFRAGGGGAEHDRLAVADGDGAVGEARHLAGLDDEILAADTDGFRCRLGHCLLPEVRSASEDDPRSHVMERSLQGKRKGRRPVFRVRYSGRAWSQRTADISRRSNRLDPPGSRKGTVRG